MSDRTSTGPGLGRRAGNGATRLTRTVKAPDAPGPRDLKARPPRPQKQRTGEQEEVDQLTAFRTGAFESLDSRNGAAP